MADCFVQNATGQLEFVADSPCTSYVVLTPAEYAAIAANPFVLTPQDGLLISVAVAGVWAAAFGWKAVMRTLNSHGEEGL